MPRLEGDLQSALRWWHWLLCPGMTCCLGCCPADLGLLVGRARPASFSEVSPCLAPCVLHKDLWSKGTKGALDHLEEVWAGTGVSPRPPLPRWAVVVSAVGNMQTQLVWVSSVLPHPQAQGLSREFLLSWPCGSREFHKYLLKSFKDCSLGLSNHCAYLCTTPSLLALENQRTRYWEPLILRSLSLF